MHRIVDFTELKAYVDIFNERGHRGFRESINPFIWWNHKWLGKIDDGIHAFMDEGLVVILELSDGLDVGNMLVFALCPQKNILQKILDICKDYGNVIYNSEFGNKYQAITKKFDGLHYVSNGRHYYNARGEKAWELSKRL
jgi:hypothetical protein